MTKTKRQSAGRTYIAWLTTAITVISALFILVLAIVTYAQMLRGFSAYDESFDKTETALAQLQVVLTQQQDDEEKDTSLLLKSFELIDTVMGSQLKSTHFSIKSTTYVMTFLMGALVLTLILLLSQTYMWNRDRKKLELWRESGFLCERLEFLPANRLKLNNIEIELNKTQIDNLLKIARSRKQGKPIHTLDIGDHGAQSTNRLREELGKKFIEKSFIKHRKQEGYWLEVEPDRIYFQHDE